MNVTEAVFEDPVAWLGGAFAALLFALAQWELVHSALKYAVRAAAQHHGPGPCHPGDAILVVRDGPQEAPPAPLGDPAKPDRFHPHRPCGDPRAPSVLVLLPPRPVRRPDRGLLAVGRTPVPGRLAKKVMQEMDSTVIFFLVLLWLAVLAHGLRKLWKSVSESAVGSALAKEAAKGVFHRLFR